MKEKIEPIECRFFENCKIAQTTAATCSQNGGGNYCGKYRLLRGI